MDAGGARLCVCEPTGKRLSGGLVPVLEDVHAQIQPLLLVLDQDEQLAPVQGDERTVGADARMAEPAAVYRKILKEKFVIFLVKRLMEELKTCRFGEEPV